MFNLAEVKPDPMNLKGAVLVVAQHQIELPARYKRALNPQYEQKEGIICVDFEPALSGLQARILGFDYYDLGLVNSNKDWEEKINEVGVGYGLEYHLQKHDPKVKIGEISSYEMRKNYLAGLFQNLMVALDANNRFAQNRAEDTLNAFLAGPRYRIPLGEIITIATTTPLHPKLIKNRLQLVLSLAEEDYPKMIRLQREYTQSVGKV
ncbi:MAG: hypothetical protein V1702_03300 [Candidatus Woesearchaeota archaeon]